MTTMTLSMGILRPAQLSGRPANAARPRREAPRSAVCSQVPDARARTANVAGQGVENLAHKRDRRMLLAAGSLALLPQAPFLSAAVAAEQDGAAFRLYEDAKNGFKLSVPSGFDLKEKAGATALFVDPERKSTQVGVTVNPVRVPDLSAFGSLEDVGEKLLGAEKAKESTLECNLVYQRERTSASGTLFFDYSYELDSTRGRKAVQTSVTIKNSKLYILNAAVKCDKESCEGFAAPIATLAEVLASFDV